MALVIMAVSGPGHDMEAGLGALGEHIWPVHRTRLLRELRARYGDLLRAPDVSSDRERSALVAAHELLNRVADVVDGPDIAVALGRLHWLLSERLPWPQGSKHLQSALTMFRYATETTAPSSPHYPTRLSDLAVALIAVFERHGDLTSLKEAVRAGRTAASHAYAGESSHTTLTNLALALLLLYEQESDPLLVAEAVNVGRRGVADTSPTDSLRPYVLSVLSVSLRMLHEIEGEAAVLEEAVDMAREAVAAAGPGHYALAGWLSSLGTSLRDLSRLWGDGSVLEEAVRIGRRAVAAAQPGSRAQPEIASELGVSLRTLSIWRGDVGLLEEAVEIGGRAVAAAPAFGSARPDIVGELGISLRALYEVRGEAALLEEAVPLLQEALAVLPSTHVARAKLAYELDCAQDALATMRERTVAELLGPRMELANPAHDEERPPRASTGGRVGPPTPAPADADARKSRGGRSTFWRAFVDGLSRALTPFPAPRRPLGSFGNLPAEDRIFYQLLEAYSALGRVPARTEEPEDPQ
ncbi:hypothetical protein ABGB14_49770 [Nonomuraea sp. B10E15]|uniref:hypothetical protein n=1 Tax=Nonomuraea sp. B10E15 TaxID=3153560 RepID=UPI00325C9275